MILSIKSFISSKNFILDHLALIKGSETVEVSSITFLDFETFEISGTTVPRIVNPSTPTLQDLF